MRTRRIGVSHPYAIKIELTYNETEISIYGCIKELLEDHAELNRYAVNKLLDGDYMRKYRKYKLRKL